MADAIHITNSTEGKPIEDRTWFRNAKAGAALLRWIVIVGLAIGGYYVYQRDVNAATAVNVVDLKNEQGRLATRLDKFEIEHRQALDRVLTRELYEAYRKADIERMNRIEITLERIAARP